MEGVAVPEGGRSAAALASAGTQEAAVAACCGQEDDSLGRPGLASLSIATRVSCMMVMVSIKVFSAGFLSSIFLNEFQCIIAKKKIDLFSKKKLQNVYVCNIFSCVSQHS